MQDDTMLIGNWQDLLDARWHFFFVLGLLLRRVIADDLRPNVITELIVKILLIHTFLL